MSYHNYEWLLHYAIFYYILLYFTILYYLLILYYTILHYSKLYYTFLYFTLLYYYFAILLLYYTILYYYNLYYLWIPYPKHPRSDMSKNAEAQEGLKAPECWLFAGYDLMIFDVDDVDVQWCLWWFVQAIDVFFPGGVSGVFCYSCLITTISSIILDCSSLSLIWWSMD